METNMRFRYWFSLFLFLLFSIHSNAQNTQLRGFSAASITYDQNKLSFGFSEQDILVTSDIADHLTFLGESVFRYDHHSEGTKFSVEVERVIMKYNYAGNHNVIIGKIHTPINYWNDIYHHGTIFFPTVGRPLVFIKNIIPMHSTGIGLEGDNFGKLKFGYDVLVANGLGSEEITDNDNYKGITLAARIKPVEGMRISASYYHDIISKGASIHHHDEDQALHEERLIPFRTVQNIITGSFAYFGNKYEVLCESSLAINHTDTTCYRRTLGSYLYAGYKVTDKVTPYIRLDQVHYQDGEVFYIKDNSSSIVAGINYQINYQANLKLEFQHLNSEITGNANKVTAQIAIGF